MNFSTSLNGLSPIEGISSYLDSDASKHGSNNIDGSEAVNIAPTDDNDKSYDSDMIKTPTMRITFHVPKKPIT